MNASRHGGIVDTASLLTGRPRTLVGFSYVDADNYKQAETIVLSTPADAASAARLLATLNADGMFVPAAVGVEDLQKRMRGGWDEDVDHPYHSITTIELTDLPATDHRTFDSFVQSFEAADWEKAAFDVEQSVSC